jgi:hypothetical protein
MCSCALLPDKLFISRERAATAASKVRNELQRWFVSTLMGQKKFHSNGHVALRTLPVEYRFNKKAWMTSDIFSEWLRKLDKRFKAERHKVLMIMDKCPAHSDVEKLEAIKLVFATESHVYNLAIRASSSMPRSSTPD